MTQKLVKIIGSYSIDAFVMLKSVTNDNFSSSTWLNFEHFVWVVLLLPWIALHRHLLVV